MAPHSNGVRNVMHSLLSAARVAAVALVLSGTAFAQQRPPVAGGAPAPAAAPAAHGGVPVGVAVIDLQFVFKNHYRFQGEIEQMKKDVEGRETALKAQRDALRAKKEGLSQYVVGSPDYRKLEGELAQEEANLMVQVQIQKKEFLEREAKIYFNAFNEIEGIVRLIAERNNIAMVIRFSRDDLKSADPQQVMQELNRVVLYTNPQIDLTDIVVGQLNKGIQPPPAPVGPTGPVAGRTAPPLR
ncbi:MAG TPA: OmpH family outer membrane protein [Pirellulales bacterium]